MTSWWEDDAWSAAPPTDEYWASSSTPASAWGSADADDWGHEAHPPGMAPWEYSKGAKGGWGMEWAPASKGVPPPPPKGKSKGPPPVTYGAPSTNYGNGFRDGQHVGWSKGYNEGYEKGYYTGKGHAKGAGTSGVDNSHGSADDEGSKPSRKKNKKGAFAQWYADFMAEDPPDKDKWPRFQCWTDQDWSDYRERNNAEMRAACVHEGSEDVDMEGTVQVDMGEYQGHKYEYEVNLVPDGNTHDMVQRAIDDVKHHKSWKAEFEADIVGWQKKLDADPSDKKTVLRPVRILQSRSVEASTRGHFQ